jgi:hypothetical protein
MAFKAAVSAVSTAAQKILVPAIKHAFATNDIIDRVKYFKDKYGLRALTLCENIAVLPPSDRQREQSEWLRTEMTSKPYPPSEYLQDIIDLYLNLIKRGYGPHSLTEEQATNGLNSIATWGGALRGGGGRKRPRQFANTPKPVKKPRRTNIRRLL